MELTAILPHVLFFGAVLLASFLYAHFEIQIEGPHGWAEKLPTWKFSNRLTNLVFGGRPITGFHFYSQTFLLLMVHLPFIVTAAWSLAMELRCLSFYLLFWILEDFLWFAMNPAFGLSKFSPEHIWWHRRAWWGFMPRDYFVLPAAGIALYVLSWTL